MFVDEGKQTVVYAMCRRLWALFTTTTTATTMSTRRTAPPVAASTMPTGMRWGAGCELDGMPHLIWAVGSHV